MVVLFPVVSAGVVIKELDFSQYVAKLSSTKVGLVGTATWGPINERTLCPQAESLIEAFGPPVKIDTLVSGHRKQLGMHVAYWALQRTSELYYVRIASGTAAYASVTLSKSATAVATYRAKYKGTLGNRLRVRISAAADTTAGVDAADLYRLEVLLDRYNKGDWEIVESYDTVTHNQTDIDNATNNPNTPYAYWTPAKINAASKWIEITLASGVYDAPDATSASLPFGTIMTGGLDGATDATDADFIGTEAAGTGLYAFADPGEIDINILVAPGQQGTNGAIFQAGAIIAEGRRDCMYLIDPPSGLSGQEVDQYMNGKGSYTSNYVVNTSYASCQYGWGYAPDVHNGGETLLPPSAAALFVYGETDASFGPHYAPFGVTRGKVPFFSRMEKKLLLGERELLQAAGHVVNPIIRLDPYGIVIWGQKTCQRSPSKLDRVNVRRMLIQLEKAIAASVVILCGDFNNFFTRQRFKQLVNPALESLVAGQGLEEFQVICDDSTNTVDAKNNSELRGKILVRPTAVAERVVVSFIITAAGVKFSELVQAA